MVNNFKKILCISSNSEIAKSIIKNFVKSGAIMLLHVRTKDALNELKSSLSNCDLSKIVFLAPAELNGSNYQYWFQKTCDQHSPDSIIVATGKLSGLKSHSEAVEINALYPIQSFEYFLEYALRDPDQKYDVVFLNSILSEISWLNPTIYGYAKAMVTYYLNNISNAHPSINVHNVLLGPVDSPLIRNTEFNSYKLLTTPGKVGKYIVECLQSNRRRFYAPFIWNFIIYPLYFIAELPKIIVASIVVYGVYLGIRRIFFS